MDHCKPFIQRLSRVDRDSPACCPVPMCPSAYALLTPASACCTFAPQHHHCNHHHHHRHGSV
ncbi:hypothetical protein BKA80DRAFT_265193 [Phyllosticta citrichinensis]